jgi:hypothetical protein
MLVKTVDTLSANATTCGADWAESVVSTLNASATRTPSTRTRRRHPDFAARVVG